MNLNLAVRFSPPLLVILIAILACLSAAKAATGEDKARAQCREKLVPVVQHCARETVAANGGRPAQYIPGCRAGDLGRGARMRHQADGRCQSRRSGGTGARN